MEMIYILPLSFSKVLFKEFIVIEKCMLYVAYPRLILCIDNDILDMKDDIFAEILILGDVIRCISISLKITSYY